MAIDSNVLLKGIVPDTTKAAAAGFKLGQDIRNAPLLRKQKEQLIAQNEQKLATGEIQAGVEQEVQNLQSIFKGASDVEGLIGKGDLVGAENYLNNRIEEGTLAKKDMSDTIKARDDLLNDIQSGMTAEQIQAKQLGELKSDKAQVVERLDMLSGKLTGTKSGLASVKGVEGDFSFRDEKGNIFSQQTFLDPNTQTTKPVLTDISGRNAEPVGKLTPVSTTGESSQQTRALDSQAQIDEQAEILRLKNSNLAEGELQKALGVNRGKITTRINSNANTSRSSRSDLLRLHRASKLIKAGKIESARNIMGQYIPGLADADAQTFNALATQYTLDVLSRQGGTKTDFDFEAAERTQQTLGNTPEANEAIMNIAFDRIDEIEDEERQFKKFKKNGGNAEDFQFKPVPIEFVQLVRADPNRITESGETISQEFKKKYGYLPTGL
jgi:hypothetical protein